jgi:hypothetical protein
MSPCVARCADPRFLLALLALTLAREAYPQTDSRDALIDELRQRIEILEKRLEQKPAPPPVAAPPPAPAPAPKPAASEEAGRADEGARALERTLVRAGGLVVPKGTYELEPRLQYSYRGFEGLRIVTDAGGVSQIAPQDISRTQFEASMALRAGLPWSMQVEIRVPYVWAYEDRATLSASRESERTSGWGDVELALAKQFVDERPGRPALLGSINWKSVTGEHELGRLSPGSGFPQLQAALTTVMRQDPLVFFGTLSYAYLFERERSGTDVDPGDSIGVKVGSLTSPALAAPGSPARPSPAATPRSASWKSVSPRCSAPGPCSMWSWESA